MKKETQVERETGREGRGSGVEGGGVEERERHTHTHKAILWTAPTNVVRPDTQCVNGTLQ